MSKHTIGTHDEWLAARLALLERERELTHLSDKLAEQRRELPWVAVEKDYRFDTEEGPSTLADLFDGRSQLLVYHFMYGPSAGDRPGRVCSFWADSFDGSIIHLSHHDVTMLCVSRAPLDRLKAYKKRMGWGFRWVSSGETDFTFDYGGAFAEGQPNPEYN